jgi:hypothetical protein
MRLDTQKILIEMEAEIVKWNCKGCKVKAINEIHAI